jgi:hypothetical protein
LGLSTLDTYRICPSHTVVKFDDSKNGIGKDVYFAMMFLIKDLNYLKKKEMS